MNDERAGIVRLELPDGRTVSLQLHYAAMDVRGHGWIIEQLEVLQRAKGGSDRAIADLLEVFTGGEIVSEQVMAGSAAAYPIGPCTRAIWSAWGLAFHGPTGRPAEDSEPDPQPAAPPTWWRRLLGRR